MYAKIPRLAASRMKASSSTSRIAITGQEASVTIRPMVERMFRALTDDHDRGVRVYGRRGGGDVAETRLSHDLVAELGHGSKDLVDAMSVPVRDEDPEPVEASFVLLVGPFPTPRAGLVPASASNPFVVLPLGTWAACWQRWAYTWGGDPSPGRVAPVGVSRAQRHAPRHGGQPSRRRGS